MKWTSDGATQPIRALRGQVALVTGCDDATGRSIALVMATAGAVVAVTARSSTACQLLARRIRAGGGQALAATGEVSTVEGCEQVIAAVTRMEHRPDILVNSASVNTLADAASHNAEGRARQVWEGNLLGPMRLIRAAAERWMSAGGSIVNISTLPSHTLSDDIEAYRTSQAALIAATRSLAIELRSSHIRINVIAHTLGEKDVARLLSGARPSGLDGDVAPDRHASVDDIADTALYLASETSSPLTGAVLLADHGWAPDRRMSPRDAGGHT